MEKDEQKTLKDIEPVMTGKFISEEYRFTEGVASCKYFSRQEAIKQIKAINKEIKKSDDKIFNAALKITKDWIKYFFNITKEESQ